MARHYEIIKRNAQRFADERNQTVWIAKARRKTDFCIIFSTDQLTKNYEIYEEVEPTVKGDTKMKRTFTVDASKKIKATTRPVKAAEDEKADPRMDQADELLSRVEDDFDYVMTGIERLGREGMLDEAIDLLNKLSDTLDSAIGIIGGNFEEDAEAEGEEL